MTSRRETVRERRNSHTHIVIRADASGKCEFLNNISGGWTKLQYLAVPMTEARAVEIAEKVGGMAISAPPIDPPARQYEYES